MGTECLESTPPGRLNINTFCPLPRHGHPATLQLRPPMNGSARRDQFTGSGRYQNLVLSDVGIVERWTDAAAAEAQRILAASSQLLQQGVGGARAGAGGCR